MAIYAAANIAAAVKSFEARGYASLGGILLNRRGVKREQEKVEELAEDMETEIIGSLDYSPLVGEAEELGKTVMEAYPDRDMAGQYRKMADAVLAACGEEVKRPMLKRLHDTAGQDTALALSQVDSLAPFTYGWNTAPRPRMDHCPYWNAAA